MAKINAHAFSIPGAKITYCYCIMVVLLVSTIFSCVIVDAIVCIYMVVLVCNKLPFQKNDYETNCCGR